MQEALDAFIKKVTVYWYKWVEIKWNYNLGGICDN